MTPGEQRRGARWVPGIILSAILLVTALLRMRVVGMPLERDEGEYAYMGQLILHGGTPYVDAYNMKLPGVYYANAAILGLFGETDVAIRLALLLINLASIILIERLGRRLVDTTAGLTAAAAYAILSLSPAVLGFAAKAEHFVVLPMLVGVLLLVDSEGRRSRARLIGAGLLFGIAVLMKQSGSAFVLFGLLYVLAIDLRHVRTGWAGAIGDAAGLGIAAAAPFALTCLGMYWAGAFAAFWFWTITYASTYAVMIPFSVATRELGQRIVDLASAAPALWILAGVGVTALLWDTRARGRALFFLLFTACSVLAVVPGLRFSEHYFILVLPAASLCIGLAVSSVSRLPIMADGHRAAALRLGLPVVAIGCTIIQQRGPLLLWSPVELSRAVYGANPFPEAVDLARYIRAHSAADERIAVVGSEPEIYFYARRRGATGYIYMYPLMEAHPFSRHLQEDMIAQIERQHPRFMILVNVDTSWTMQPNSSRLVLDWAEHAVNSAYRVVGIAEISADGPAVYRWGADARASPPRSRSSVVLFERQDPAPA